MDRPETQSKSESPSAPSATSPARESETDFWNWVEREKIFINHPREACRAFYAGREVQPATRAEKTLAEEALIQLCLWARKPQGNATKALAAYHEVEKQANIVAEERALVSTSREAEEGSGVQLGEDKSSPKLPVTRGEVSEEAIQMLVDIENGYTVDGCANGNSDHATYILSALVSKPEHTPDLPTPPPTTNAET